MLRSCRRKYRGKVIVDNDGSKVSTLFSMVNTDGDILKIVASYHIPPTVLCRRAELDEPACDDSSSDLVIYEEMLEAGLRFPMFSCLCRILHYFSLTPGRLAPNGWSVLLGFLALWRRVHQEDAFPVKFHAAYNLIESPAPNRGWYYLTPGGDFPVLSKDQEQKLQAMRNHPDKNLGILLPKESGRINGTPSDPPSFIRTGGPSLGTSSKQKAIDKEVIGARLSSRSTPPTGARPSSRSAPPSKAARVDSTSRGNSPPVTFKASSLASTPSGGARPCSHRAASPAASPQPASSSSTIATLESSSLAVPSATHSCPLRSGAPAGAPAWVGPMLGNPLVIREKLERFVFPPEVTQINALGTERVIDTFLESLAQENESIQKELSIAQKKIAALEAAREASEADLMEARERATGLETELSAARERATRAEAELVKAHERASLSEAELAQTRERALLRETVVATEMKAAHDRASQAEKELADGLADAFINGYEELQGKISTAFPDIDFSGFVPTEAPDDSNGRSDEDDDYDTGDDAEDDDEDEEGSSESD
ncbi:hypothetical protein CKAN_01401200 [Cinnamomum micranthum f. kanehirae]|uniref:Transposase (putative) gypsy type domain-containing protein n=1 Tax=Cinnamomum micranthum f. kanehirae TaxID=337451 RepID=A0A443P360_9MAGN|nr:hypothetical protein CKAN_01401200 [Cinnamomum micranthum f. kanehirae]